METHYYNAFWHKDKFNIESDGLTYEEAVDQISDYALYAYTLEVSLEGVRRMDLEVEMLATIYPEYEELTGHEMGVAPGKV